MNHRILFLSLSLIASTGAILPRDILAASQTAFHWRKDFTKAEAEAKSLDRPLLIHFHAKWCGPCRQMEAQVFNLPAVQGALADKVVAVKIDADEHPDLMSRFGVASLPSDVFVSPQGKILSRKSGFQSQGEYLATLSGVRTQYDASKKVLVAKQPPKAAAPSKPAPSPATKSAAPQVAAAKPAPAKAKTPDKLASASQNGIQKTNASKAAVSLSPPQPLVGLDGYCPVTLWKSRKWQRGKKDHKTEYQGLTYYFASASERDEFVANPVRYAPRLLGCDPVVLADSDRPIAGTSRYGAYYDGQLYLFESSESRIRFRGDPTRYTGSRHAFQVNQIQKRKA